ncbi:GNAT family protein [Gilvimarinus sp. SDUM040013]|uniref:GNAT family protein n=1 Tax=Gilvimarinus gilvus TaxID=3058038 RepID=A0ABU4RTS5_9GAMM|nr:GNAT family protein [Gilvimarinus sp. SDUM040013]MDO3386798.1 GNAT family protein [Gilvimarinus sp. SDUM040013]MDX6848272.1 GNAT family protein [Gilvimarinus sp. SDUM040013]
MISDNAIALSDELVMRLLQADDAPMLFTQIDRNRLHLRQWLPWLDDATQLTDSEHFIGLTRNESQSGAAYTFAITLQQELIGICSLDAIEQNKQSANIGYWLAEAHCGQGIMTRCVERLITIAFRDIGLRQLHLNTAEGNGKSRAIAERLHFRQRYKILNAEDLYGEWIDHIRYTLNTEDWTTDR